MLVDSHCHLDFPDFANEVDAVVARARANGIGVLLTISTRVRRFGEVLALAERYEDVVCSVGTHPHNAHEELDVNAAELARLAAHPKVVAIGEAGLDNHYENGSPAAQAQGLRTHIEAARRTGLPLVIHSREADAEMGALLADEMARGAFKGVLHCYTGGAELAWRGIEMGLYVSFSGIVTFKNAPALRKLAAELPTDRILVETDAPYLAPVPYRGKRNEPAYVRETATVVAELRGVSLEALAAQTTENFFRLFDKAQAARAAA